MSSLRYNCKGAKHLVSIPGGWENKKITKATCTGRQWVRATSAPESPEIGNGKELVTVDWIHWQEMEKGSITT